MPGSELSQDELQGRVLEFLFDHANDSAQRLTYITVAGRTGLPDARVDMALQSLESARLLRATHNTMSGSHYSISEKGYRQIEQYRLAPGHSAIVPVPATDRVVTLKDNQREILTAASADLIDQLSQTNAVDGDNDLRGRFIAQLEAARELVRASSVRAYLFYQLVVEVLSRLVTVYGKSALGVAAAKLLELYVEHLVGAV